jgi:hypothetical protein
MHPRISTKFFHGNLNLSRGSQYQNSRKRKLEFSQPTEVFVFLKNRILKNNE